LFKLISWINCCLHDCWYNAWTLLFSALTEYLISHICVIFCAWIYAFRIGLLTADIIRFHIINFFNKLLFISWLREFLIFLLVRIFHFWLLNFNFAMALWDQTGLIEATIRYTLICAWLADNCRHCLIHLIVQILLFMLPYILESISKIMDSTSDILNCGLSSIKDARDITPRFQESIRYKGEIRGSCICYGLNT